MPAGRGLSSRLSVLLLIGLSLITYHGVGTFDFVLIDDPTYITTNPMVFSGISFQGLKWAFCTIHGEHYIPLVQLSWMLDAQMFGQWAGGYHLINLALHVANSTLLFLLWERLVGSTTKSFLLAALFAIHPAHVESVAWISERKDCLSTFFALMTMICYVQSVKTDRAKWRMITALVYLACLLCKSMFVTLPLLLVLFDDWPLRRMENLPLKGATHAKTQTTSPWDGQFGFVWRAFLVGMRGKRELVIMSIVFAVVAYIAQSPNHSSPHAFELTTPTRIIAALVAYPTYLRLVTYPVDLAVFHPYPSDVFSTSAAIWSTALIVGITLACTRLRKRYPYLFFGWMWFVVGLLPVVGLIRIGDYHVADRYLYTPSTGIFVIVIWGAGDLLSSVTVAQFSRLKHGLATCLIATGVLTAQSQIETWRDSESLFRHAIAVTPPNAFMYCNLGSTLVLKGRHSEACEQFQKSISIGPWHFVAHRNLGMTYLALGQSDAAVLELRQAVSLVPQNLLIRADLARAVIDCTVTAIVEKELAHAREVIEHDIALLNPLTDQPQFCRQVAELSYLRGIVARRYGELASAIEHLSSAIRRDSAHFKARGELVACCLDAGKASAHSGDLPNAIKLFSLAVETDPASVHSRYNHGLALARQGQLSDATTEFRECLRQQPRFAVAHLGIAQILQFRGHPTEAQYHLDAARQLQLSEREIKTGRD